MRKLWPIVSVVAAATALAAAAFAFSSFGSSTASADNGPHIKGWGATADGCAGCHRAHRAQAEPNLLEDQQALCESCHDVSASGSALDVVSGTDDATTGALRGGGFGNARINTADASLPPTAAIGVLASPGQTTQSKHSVDGSAQTIWGYGAINAVADPGKTAFNLACGKCHDPHGSGNYRILRTIPASLLGYGEAAPAFMPKLWNDTNGDGKITAGETTLLADEVAKNYDTTNYWDVTYTDQWQASVQAPPGPIADVETTGRQVGRWCTTCHSRYLASTGSADADSGDAVFKFRHTSNPEGRDTHGRAGPVTLSGSCLKCHVSHGTNATAATGLNTYSGGVEWPDATAGSGTTNSRLLRMNNRGICQKCHNK